METVFLSITKSDLQDLIGATVMACLRRTSQNHTPAKEDKQWLDLKELCEYLPDKPAKATIYGYVSANTIPYHKGAKKLRFLKSEIDTWLMQGRKKTVAEFATEADTHLSNLKKR